MKRVFETVVVVLVLLSLSGCLQYHTLIRVKPDGSGSIEQTFLMSKEAIAMMRTFVEQMATSLEEETEEPIQMFEKGEKGFDIFDEDELKRNASDMGKGVTYVSGKKIITDESEGFKASYTFIDINKVKINQNPSEQVPSSPGEESEKKKEFLTFRLNKGKTSTLIIRMPEQEDKPMGATEDSKVTEPDEEQLEQAMAQMKQFFKGMKISMAVEVGGSIVKTNATHRDGSKITLMELDFGKLLEMPDKLSEFSRLQPETLEDSKEFLNGLEGFKVDLNREIKVEFK